MGRIETPKTVKVNIKGGEVYIDDNKIPNIESY